MFGRRSPDAAYLRSQAVPTVAVGASVVLRGLALAVVGAPDDPSERKRLGQLLLDELNAAAGLPTVALTVADRAQVHQHDGRRLQSKTYGYYRCALQNGVVSRSTIRIYHRTAVRQQVISSKVFLNTLLHEWTHHYDFAGLRLPRSPHTAGFYARLRSLADSLQVGFVLPPEPEPAAVAADAAIR